jgi:hypothetical protein
MKEQLLGMGLMVVITYLLLRFRDFFLGLGQNGSAQELQGPRLADVVRVPANSNFGPASQYQILRRPRWSLCQIETILLSSVAHAWKRGELFCNAQ